jgi:hypothetical protein
MHTKQSLKLAPRAAELNPFIARDRYGAAVNAKAEPRLSDGLKPNC